MSGDVHGAADAPSRSRGAATGEVAAAFAKLGLISFGGPIAHLGYFHTEFVDRRRWLSEEEYADLVALCQFLPGPASSQFVFALGLQRAGLTGAVLSSLAFLTPSAVLLILFAYGVSGAGNLAQAGWVHGLKLAAVAVVAHAVWGMWGKLCPDWPRVAICLLAAAAVLLVPNAWAQVAVIVASAILGWVLFRRAVHLPRPGAHEGVRGHAPAIASLLLFGLLLLAAPAAARATGSQSLAVFDAFYRSGSLVFGGGHVILPLLRSEVVPPGWVSDDAFLAGYGAAQAIPGPLFTFAGYLGAVIYAGPNAWLSGAWCLLAIFLPSCLLVGGVLPYWHQLRSMPWAQAGLRGAGAGVVGILLAALYTPVFTEGVRDARDLAVALLALGLLKVVKAPPVVVVALCAAAGQWLLR
ncbi:MAG: chromate efflux transporter [Phycisphaerales bacterium JB039]